LGAGTLPSNPEAAQHLRDQLAHLEVVPAQGAATSDRLSQVVNRKFVFPANDQNLESVTLQEVAPGKALLLTERVAGRDLAIPCGYHEWQKARAPLQVGKLAQFPDEPVAGTFAWTNDTCTIKICAYETPYQKTLTLKFEGGQVILGSELNVAFGPTKLPSLNGRSE
jgi:hypothetical protein